MLSNKYFTNLGGLWFSSLFLIILCLLLYKSLNPDLLVIYILNDIWFVFISFSVFGSLWSICFADSFKLRRNYWVHRVAFQFARNLCLVQILTTRFVTNTLNQAMIWSRCKDKLQFDRCDFSRHLLSVQSTLSVYKLWYKSLSWTV